LIEDAVHPRRKLLGKLLQIDDATQQIVWRQTLDDVLFENLVGAFPNDGIRIEGRIERVDHAIEIQQRLRNHRELGRQTEPAISRDLCNFEYDPARVVLAQDRVAVFRDDLGDSPVENLAIKSLLRFTHLDGRFRSRVAAPFTDREQQAQKVVLETARGSAHHAQIE
jgi:hypothetical protein